MAGAEETAVPRFDSPSPSEEELSSTVKYLVVSDPSVRNAEWEVNITFGRKR